MQYKYCTTDVAKKNLDFLKNLCCFYVEEVIGNRARISFYTSDGEFIFETILDLNQESIIKEIVAKSFSRGVEVGESVVRNGILNILNLKK